MSDLARAQRQILTLIDMAVRSPNEPEGRNAAVQACRLIREHGFLVLQPRDLVPPAPPPKPSTAASAPVTAKPKRSRKRSPEEIQTFLRETGDTIAVAGDSAARAAASVGQAIDAAKVLSSLFRGR